MAWNTPSTWAAAAVLTAAQLNAQLRDNMKAIGDPWTAYTPTWTAAGTNPVLNNGTISGAYRQAGKTIDFRILITMGSTTTYGTGTYSFGLPVPPLIAVTTEGVDISAQCRDDSAPARRFRFGYISSGAIVLADADGAVVTPTVPFTFAQNDTIGITGSYEAA